MSLCLPLKYLEIISNVMHTRNSLAKSFAVGLHKEVRVKVSYFQTIVMLKWEIDIKLLHKDLRCRCRVWRFNIFIKSGC